MSLSTKEYADPHLDEDTPMCVSGLTICACSGGLGQVFPRYTNSKRWILGLPGWCGSFTVSECYHSNSYTVARCTEVKEATDPTVGPDMNHMFGVVSQV